MSIEIKNDDEYLKDRQRIINNILEDTKIKQQNGRLWTPFHDMQMYEYVIKYNFNFFDIANRFQALCNNKKKYEYSEDAVRLHWAFLHAMRMNNQIPNEKYYQQMKLKYDKNEETTFKTVTQDKKDNMALTEEEDIKRMKEEFEKMQKEKNMTEEEKRKKKLQEEEEAKKKKKKLEEEKKRIEEENKPLKSTLYKEEPQFIKDLFSKEVPKEIKEKLEQDKGKYTNNNNNKNKPIDFSKISHDFTLIPIKPLIQDSKNNTNTNKNNNEEEELFPIKSNKQKNSSLESLKEHEKTISTKSLESQLKNTKNMNDYIQEDPVLKKQYEQLNNFCKFATESINYIVNKETGLDDKTNTAEKKKTIEEANKKLNELFLGPIYQKTQEEGFNIDDFNKKIEEEEHKMYFETTNYDNYMKTIPADKDQETKRKKFQEHLFAKANQMSTQELLDRISDIIKQPVSNSSSSTNLSRNSNNNINTRIETALNDVNNNEPQNQDLNRQILNTVVRNINNNEENNSNIEEDQKSEKTKAQSETVNNDINSSMNQGTLSEVSNIDKRYRHVYKGMIYYTDKPDENKNKKNNNKNKNKKNSDDELEYEDDSDEEDYNK